MAKTKWNLTLCFFLSLFLGCEMLDKHPYDIDIEGETYINTHNIERIEELCKDKDTIRFVSMGDSQRFYDDTEALVRCVNARHDIDFLIHNGDLSDFGVTDEFLWQRDILSKLDVPYVALIGNHDCLATGEEVFSKIWGNPNFSFKAGKVKFVCLNTNAIEYDYSRPIPDFEFLENELKKPNEGIEKTVVSMHVRPFCSDFNNNVARVFQRYIKEFPNLQFCTAAHEHKAFELDLFGDGIIYYMSDCMKHRSFYIFTITPDGYERELVFF